jgi:hypothetical protein
MLALPPVAPWLREVGVAAAVRAFPHLARGTELNVEQTIMPQAGQPRWTTTASLREARSVRPSAARFQAAFWVRPL